VDIYFEKIAAVHEMTPLCPFDLTGIEIGAENGIVYLNMLKYNVRIVGLGKLKQILDPLIVQAKLVNELKAVPLFIEFGLGVMLRYFSRHPKEFEKWFEQMLLQEKGKGTIEVQTIIKQALGIGENRSTTPA